MALRVSSLRCTNSVAIGGRADILRACWLRAILGACAPPPFHNPSFCESGVSRTLVVVLMSGPHELYAHAGWKLFILHEIVLLHSFHEQSGVPRLLERAVNQRLGSSGRLAGVMSATSASRGAPRMPLPKRSRNLAVMRIPSGMEFSERTGLSPAFTAISVLRQVDPCATPLIST